MDPCRRTNIPIGCWYLCRSSESSGMKFFLPPLIRLRPSTPMFAALSSSLHVPPTCSNVVRELVSKGFTICYLCRKDWNNIPDRFGYRPTPSYVSKHIKTSGFRFSEFPDVAIEFQNQNYGVQKSPQAKMIPFWGVSLVDRTEHDTYCGGSQ